jgi:hypothetical protein
VTARHFARLYSYAIQRYIKGRNHLSGAQRQQLISVLAETEEKCLRVLLGRPQTTIRKAVERGDYEGLLLEHNRLFGDPTQPGQLPRKLKFDYERADGGRQSAPPVLPNPRQTEAGE